MARTIQKINTVEGNTAPPLVLTAQRSSIAIPLTGCTVNLIITLSGIQTNVGHTLCTITDVVNGIVSYVRQATDTPTAGSYFCDLVVTYPDTTTEVLYTQLKLIVAKKSNSLV